MNETLADLAERAKQLIIDNSLPSDTQILDVPTCFDGPCSSRGWLAQKGVAAAITENTRVTVAVTVKR